MNRSVNCIKMLLLLKARGFLRREELAKELQCNLRNISEYRDVLVDAGYQIESTRGKYGGYRLISGTLFPVVGLRDDEILALQSAGKYIQSHPDFLYTTSFQKALDKILATTSMRMEEDGIYMESDGTRLSYEMKEAIRLCELAKKEHRVVSMEYKSLHADTYTPIRIHPYEILNDKGSYYCVAYSLKAKDYRNFKFSDERMRHVQMTTHIFQRNDDFRLMEHVGKSGLMKDEPFALHIRLWGAAALLFREKPFGYVQRMQWEDHSLYVETIVEGKLQSIRFLLGQGNECELLAPLQLREELLKTIRHMQKNYNT